eukprot:752801-Hanusia_phi.AAC.4
MLHKILLAPRRMLDDAPWPWKGAWNSDMPAFFQGMPSGVNDNIFDDLDVTPVSYNYTDVSYDFEVSLILTQSLTACRPHRVPAELVGRCDRHLLSVTFSSSRRVGICDVSATHTHLLS